MKGASILDLWDFFFFFFMNDKESACDADQGLIPGLESSSGEGNGSPLQ